MKLKLNQDFLAPDFFESTRLLGIMAPIKSYFFCWQINHQLGMSFKLNNEKELLLKKKQRNYFFNIYMWNEPMTFLEHFIYQNQYDGEYLLPEFRNMDFLWLMKGDIVDEEKYKWIVDSIKKITGVQLVVELQTDQIKNKQHLII